MTITATDYLRAVETDADGLADHYATILDAPCSEQAAWYTAPGSIITAAHSYVRMGLRVLPLAAGSKVPIGGKCCGGSHARGVTQALADPGAVTAWWAAHPHANVGIATGILVDVIDQDGTDGARTWCRSAHPAVLGVASTPRAGGIHRYTPATGRGNGVGIVPGLDYRGVGGFVVAPPSIVNGTSYTWITPLTLEHTP